MMCGISYFVNTSSRACCICALVGLMVATLGSGVAAADRGDANELQFRRVFVPAESPEKWPIGDQRYLAIPQGEFAKLLAEAMESANQGAASVSFQRAAFSAEYASNSANSESVVEGSAELEVVLPDEAQRLVPLEPLNFPVKRAEWENDGDRAAEVGLWSRDGVEGNLAVLADSSGVLRFNWEMAASAYSGTRSVFEFQFPTASIRTFKLTTDESFRVSLSGSELVRSVAEGGGKVTHHYLLAPVKEHQLIVDEARRAPSSRTEPLVSQTTDYQLTPEGLTFTTAFHLEAERALEMPLRLSLPAKVKVLAITSDGEETTWQVANDIDEANSSPQLLVEWSGDVAPRTIEIRGMSQFPLYQRWELPAIRAENVRWTEGTVSLEVASSLRLMSLSPHLALLEHVVGFAGESFTEEVYRLEEWSDRASVELMVGRPEPKLNITRATSVEFQPNQQTARSELLLASSGPGIFQCDAEVAAGWTIESVEAETSSLLVDWHLHEVAGRNLLRLRFDRRIDTRNPVRLAINARSMADLDQREIPLEWLRVLHFTDAKFDHDFVQLLSTSRTPQQLLHGLDDQRVRRDAIPSSAVELLEVPTAGLLVDATELSPDQLVGFAPGPARYQANVFQEFAVVADSVETNYRVDVTPTEGFVSQVEFELESSISRSISWELVTLDDDGQQVRYSLPALVRFEPNGRISYELRLPAATDQPFRIEASFTQPFESSHHCAVLRITETEDWYGQASIRGPDVGLKVIDSGWVFIGSPAVAFDSTQRLPVLGCYRWDYKTSSRMPVARLEIEQYSEVSATPRLVARRASYQTLQTPGGDVKVEARYQFENRGQSVAEFLLPANSTLVEVRRGTRSFAPGEVLVDEQLCRVPLNTERSSQSVTLKFYQHGAPLGLWAHLILPQPECRFVVELTEWTLWIPPQYELVGGDAAGGRTSRRSRLLGPLTPSRYHVASRTRRTMGWNPVWSLPRSVRKHKESAVEIVNQFNHHSTRNLGLTPGEILQGIVSELGIDDLVVIDQVELLRRNIQLERSPTDHLSVGRTMLDANDNSLAGVEPSIQGAFTDLGLALLATPNAIFLTSKERIAHSRSELSETLVPGVYATASTRVIEPENLPLARQSQGASQPRELANEPFASATHTGDIVNDSNWSAIGWQAKTLEFIDVPPTISIERSQFSAALWIAVFFLTMVMGRWKLVTHPERMLLGLALSAVACLIFPETWLVLPQAIFWGLLASMLLLAIDRRLPSRAKQPTPSPRLAPEASSVIVLSLLLMWTTEAASGQSDVRPEKSASAALHQVFLPVDADGNQAGDDVYLSEDFLSRLRRASGKRADHGARWVARSARIAGNLPSRDVPPTEDASPESLPWTISLQLETFARETVVQLPFVRDQVVWRNALHRLDGSPVAVKWQADNRLSVVIPEEGIHRLELAFEPFTHVIGEEAHLQLNVPPIPNTQLELQLPTDLEEVHISTSGRKEPSLEGQTLRTALGSSGIVDLRWQVHQPSEKSASLDYQQLNWLHVDRSRAWLDVLLQVNGDEPLPSHVDVDVSPQLRPRPLGEDSPIRKFERIEGNRWRLHFRDSPSSGASSAESPSRAPVDPANRILLRFDFLRTDSIGRFHFPRVRIVEFPARRSLFAVTVMAGLSYEEQLASGMQSVGVREFFEQWGTSATQPLFAYAVTSNLPRWSLSVRPDPQSFAAQQVVEVLATAAGAKVQYEAVIDEVAGRWHSHLLRVPPSLEVQQIEVRRDAGGERLPLRWQRVSDSQIAILLSEPLDEPHLLQLEGFIPTAANQELRLPAIQLAGDTRGEVRLDLYRRDDIVLRWMDDELTPSVVKQAGLPQEPGSILVGQYQWNVRRLPFPSQLQISENNPRLEVDSVTTVDSTSTAWRASYHAAVKVAEGTLSQVKVLAHPSFRDPRVESDTISCNVSQSIRTRAGQEITISLSHPIEEGEEFDFHLSSVLNMAGDTRLEVPNMRVADASERRFVLLPTRTANESVAWQRTVGMRRTRLPAHLQRLVEHSADKLAFHVEQERFFAQVRAYSGPMRNARIRSKTVTGYLDQQGNLVAEAEIVVQPGRAAECAVRLPEGAQITSLTAGGEMVALQPGEDGAWRVSLGPPFLPIIVQVGYKVRLQQEEGQWMLAAPEVLIGDLMLPSPTVGWQLTLADGLRIERELAGQQVDALQYHRSSLATALDTLEEASALAVELPLFEARNWYHSWQNHVNRLRRDYATLRSRGASSMAEATSNATVDEMLAASATGRLALLESELAKHEPPTANNTLRGISLESGVRRGITRRLPVRYFTSDSQGLLVVEPAAATDGLVGRWFAAVMVLAICWGVWRAKLVEPISHLAERAPYALTFALGLVWWLFLWPSALGALVMLAATLSWAWPRRHRITGNESDRSVTQAA